MIQSNLFAGVFFTSFRGWHWRENQARGLREGSTAMRVRAAKRHSRNFGFRTEDCPRITRNTSKKFERLNEANRRKGEDRTAFASSGLCRIRFRVFSRISRAIGFPLNNPRSFSGASPDVLFASLRDLSADHRHFHVSGFIDRNQVGSFSDIDRATGIIDSEKPRRIRARHRGDRRV